LRTSIESKSPAFPAWALRSLSESVQGMPIWRFKKGPWLTEKTARKLEIRGGRLRTELKKTQELDTKCRPKVKMKPLGHRKSWKTRPGQDMRHMCYVWLSCIDMVLHCHRCARTRNQAPDEGQKPLFSFSVGKWW
jgi:hypothetical protein